MKKQEVQIQSSTNEEVLTPSQAGKLFSVSGWAMYKRAKKRNCSSSQDRKQNIFSEK